MLSEQTEEVPRYVWAEEYQVESEKASWRREWHLQGSLKMIQASWCVKEGTLGLCKCQGSEEKFRGHGMGQGGNRIQVVGNLDHHSGEAPGHERSSGEEAMHAGAQAPGRYLKERGSIANCLRLPGT